MSIPCGVIQYVSQNPGQNSRDTSPSPLDSVGCHKSNTFYVILHMLRTSTLFRRSGGKILFISVYCQLAANSIEKHMNHRQNLLAVIVDGYVLPQRIGCGFCGSPYLDRVSFLPLLILCSWCAP